MHQKASPVNSELCVWMSAGLLTYKLCDRDFDCDHCPLDAALRGRQQACRGLVPLTGPAREDMLFPSNFLYSTGHSWFQKSADGSPGFRFGVDAFAAAVIGHVDEVSWSSSDRVCQIGEVVCEIHLGLGVLELRTPIAGKVLRGNQSLRDRPELVVSAPYSDGWLLECASTDDTAFDQLVPAERAQARTELDLQRFRRRVAHGLLADADSVGPTLPDGGELLTDLRQMLGGTRYLEILRELVH